MSTIENPLEPLLRCEVRPHRESAILALVGEVDLDTAPIVEAELAELRERGFASLLVDLADVTFIDSTGLRLLITWTRRAEQDGTRFGVLSGCSPVARRALELACLDRHLLVVPR